MATSRQDTLRLTLNRRGFLMGAAGLALTAAGCGGSGGDTPGERYSGTYRFFDGDRDIAASMSVDRDGWATFWTLLADDNNPFADFGQFELFDNEFSQVFDGVRTYGEFIGSTIVGRTEDADTPSFGFNWAMTKEVRAGGSLPPDDLIGTFDGEATIDGIDTIALVTVSPDGNATYFGAFDDPDTADVELYAFEGLAFDRDGDGYDYFLDLYGDNIDLRDLAGSDIGVRYTFGTNVASLGVVAGDRFDWTLMRTRVTRGKRRARIATGAQGLQRAVTALRAKRSR